MKLRWPAVPDEIRRGWPIILGASLGIASGVAILFLSFSMFIVPLTRELGVTRGQFVIVQAMIITSMFGSPLVGWLTDRFGVKRVYAVSALLVASVNTGAALFANSLLHMGITIALVGIVGPGTGSVVLSRAINAHFPNRRGTALGLMAVGVSVLAIMAPPLLQRVLEMGGWRGTFMVMSAISVLVGIPAVLALVPDSKRGGAQTPGYVPSGDKAFLRTRDFWLLTFALIAMSLATAGAGGQLAPMVQDAGLNARTAALALSFFSAGTFIGRLGGGWLLDRFEPRRVAFLLTLLPAIGFVFLLLAAGLVPAILLAVTIIGIQQGAEIDIFAYMIGRRYPIAQYGTVYGTLVGLGWIGNVGGLVAMGRAYDYFGGYAQAQLAAIVALALSAFALLMVTLPAKPAMPAQASDPE